MDVPEETLEQMRAVKSALDDLEQHMQPFLEAAPKQVNSQLTPLERVKVHLALAQSVVVLYQLHRRLAAENMGNHPLQKELERLAAYEKKVKKAITADDLARHRPGTSLNIAAANRFIDAAIPDLTQEQKQAIRNLGKRSAVADAPPAECDTSSKRSRKLTSSSEQQPQHQQSPSRGAAGDINEDVSQQQCTEPAGLRKAAAAKSEAADFLREILADGADSESSASDEGQ